MTSKPDSVSTLGYHWTDRTGRPLEPQVHWDATGTTLAEASTQWCSSGDPVLICIIGTHWKTTGATSTVGCHWNHTGWCLHPVVSQWRSSVNLHNWNTLEDHWKATGRPLEDHWKHPGISPVAFQCTLGSKFQAHWIATGLPLEDHWLRVRELRRHHAHYDVTAICRGEYVVKIKSTIIVDFLTILHSSSKCNSKLATIKQTHNHAKIEFLQNTFNITLYKLF